MNTILSIQRVALVALALATASVTATLAQTTNTPSTTPPAGTDGGGRHHDKEAVLTPAEQAQLKKAYTAALAGNPSLQTEETNLKQQHDTLKSQGKSDATKGQWQALKEQEHTFKKQLEAAELAIDPTLAPIFAKLKAAHKESKSE